MGRDVVQRWSKRQAIRRLALSRRGSSFVGHRCRVSGGGIFFFLMLYSLHVIAFRPGLVARQRCNLKAPLGLVTSSTFPFSVTTSIVGLHASTAPLQSTATYECLFDIQLPEGRCVGLALPDLPDDHPDALVGDRILESSSSSSSANSNYHGGGSQYTQEEQHQRHWIYNYLHTDEIRYGLQLSRQTQASFWMGRLALRQALSSSSSPCAAVSTRSILKDPHGRPRLPPGFLGSISHKGRTGVALVTPAPAPDGEYSLSSSSTSIQPYLGIGVDIEETKPKRRSVARKVLTPNEQRNLGQLPDVTPEEEVLLRFSLKESIYKAMHPLICQYVGFMEAEVQPLPDGTATATFMLKSGVHHQFETVTAHWQRIGGYFLSTSSVRLRGNATVEPFSGRDECEL